MERHELVDKIAEAIRESNPKGLDLEKAFLLVEPELFDFDINGIVGFTVLTTSWSNGIQIAFPYKASEKEVIFMSKFISNLQTLLL